MMGYQGVRVKGMKGMIKVDWSKSLEHKHEAREIGGDSWGAEGVRYLSGKGEVRGASYRGG